MVNLGRDEIIEKAIQNGMKRDIDIALSNRCIRAAVILIYCGMDVMAYLDMPKGNKEVTKSDFIRWAGTWVRFPCSEQVTGADFYGARCAMLHAYGVRSRMSHAGRCRMIGYRTDRIPPICFNPEVSNELVIVSVPVLRDVFFEGVDDFLKNSFLDEAKAPLVDERLMTFIQNFPAPSTQ